MASHRRANVENQWLYPETNTWYSLRTGKSPFLIGKSSISMGHLCGIPSGKHTKNYGKSPCSMGKSTISMAIFTSYVTNYQRVTLLYVLHIEPRKNAKKHIPIRRTLKAHRLWPRSGKTSVFPKLVGWSSSIFFSSEWLFWSQNRTDPWQPMADAFYIILCTGDVSKVPCHCLAMLVLSGGAVHFFRENHQIHLSLKLRSTHGSPEWPSLHLHSFSFTHWDICWCLPIRKMIDTIKKHIK